MAASELDMQVLIVGTGGQGVVLMASVLSEMASMVYGKVITSETHGMAMRGGSVKASVKMGDYSSPLIPSGSADVLVGLDSMEARNHMYILSPKGVSIVNTPELGGFDYTIDAAGIALRENLSRALNMIMLGLFLKVSGSGLGLKEAISVVRNLSPPRYREDNIRALNLGFSFA